MEQYFFPIFNTIIGFVGLMIGFEKYQPFSPEKKEIMIKKWGLYFKVAGIILFLGGIIEIIRAIN